MHAILKLDCLDLIIVNVVPKLSDASNFCSTSSCLILRSNCTIISVVFFIVTALDLGEDSSAFSSQILVFLLEKILIASPCNFDFKHGSLVLRVIIL